MVLLRKARRRIPSRVPQRPDDLFDYAPILPLQPLGRLGRRQGVEWPSAGREPKDDLSTWIVTDDWPRPLPVTEAEIDVFEAWFGDVFDELFGPCQ